MDPGCFGLDAAGRLVDDRYFIFFNQLASPEQALTLHDPMKGNFGLNLSRLPDNVQQLVFTTTVDGTGSVRDLGDCVWELRTPGEHGVALAQFAFHGRELEDVQALMVAKIYLKDGWRIAAIGQGFTGGLGALLRHFGGEEII